MKDSNDMGCSELDFSIKIPSDGPSFDKSDVPQSAGEKLADIQTNNLITENTESTSTIETILAVKPEADLKHSKMQLAMLKLQALQIRYLAMLVRLSLTMKWR